MLETLEPETIAKPRLSRIRPGFWRNLWHIPDECVDCMTAFALGWNHATENEWLCPKRHVSAEIAETVALRDLAQADPILRGVVAYIRAVHFRDDTQH